MRIASTHKSILLSAIALAGWIGCQTSPDQTASSDLTSSQGSELFLAVKNTDTCAALQAGLSAGTAADSAAFAVACVIEVPSRPKAPGAVPDSGLRRRWIKAHIDSGSTELVPFARLDKQICDSLKTTDTASFNKYCRLPPPPPPLVKRAVCDSLKAVLDATDTSSADFLRLRHDFAAKCLVPKAPPPPPPAKKH